MSTAATPTATIAARFTTTNFSEAFLFLVSFFLFIAILLLRLKITAFFSLGLRDWAEDAAIEG
jgi:hypothetical protein